MKTSKLLLAIGWLVLPVSLFAQQDSLAKNKMRTSRDPGYFSNMYMGLEIGASPGYKNFGQVAIHVQFEDHYLKIKGSSAFDEPGEAQKLAYKRNKDCNCTEANGVTDISFMYGKSFRFFNFMQVQFGAGPSVFIKTSPDEEFNSAKLPGELEKYKYRVSPGVTTEVRYVIQLKRFLAFSAAVHHSTNPIKSYSGWSAGFALGLF